MELQILDDISKEEDVDYKDTLDVVQLVSLNWSLTEI